MLDEWFCRIAGREIGPLSFQHLQAMAATGQIVPNDRVRQGAAGNWMPADDVTGLFPAGVELSLSDVELSLSDAEPAGASASPPPLSQDLPQAEPVSEPAPAQKDADNLGAALVRARRRRRRQRLLARVTAVVLAGLGIAGLIWIVAEYRDQTRRGAGLAAMAKKAAVATPDELPGEDIHAALTDKPAAGLAQSAGEEKPSEQPSEQPAEQKEPEQKEDESKWIDASMLPAVLDKIRVTLLSVAWQGPETRKREGYRLAVEIEVQNGGVALPVMFAGWSPDATQRGVILTDERRKTYQALPADPEATVANLLPIKINPGKTANDVLLFEAPDAKVKFLRLQLSALAFGKDGIAYFKIPASMIGGNPPVPPPPKPAKKAVPAKPPAAKKADGGPTGDPKLDFGISPDAPPP